MEIKVETTDNTIIQGKLISFSDVNRIARKNNGLKYMMNIMDINSSKNICYMLFKDEIMDINYLVKL